MIVNRLPIKSILIGTLLFCGIAIAAPKARGNEMPQQLSQLTKPVVQAINMDKN
jgi:hypothetical protein